MDVTSSVKVHGVAYGTPEYLRGLIEWSDKGKAPLQEYGNWVNAEYSKHDVYFRPQDPKSTGNRFESLRTTGPSRVFSLVHGGEAALFSGNIKFQHRPDYGQYTQEQTTALDQVSNADWLDDPHAETEIRLALRDTIRYGLGAVITFVRGAEPIYTREKLRELAEEDQLLAATAAAVVAESAYMASLGPVEPKPDSFDGPAKIVRTEFISFKDLIVDTHVKRHREMRFIGRRLQLDGERLRSVKGLKNIRSITPDENTGLVKGVELFVRRGSMLWERFLYAETENLILSRDTVPIDGVDLLSWSEDGDGLFGPSDIATVHDLILGEKLLMTKLTQATARSGANTNLYDKDKLTDTDLAKVTVDPITGSWIGMEAPVSGRISDAIMRLPSDAVSPEVVTTLLTLERGFQATTGLGPNQIGMPLKSETSATEAQTLASSSEARLRHKLHAVDAWLASIGRKRLALMAHYYSDTDVARLVPASTLQIWAGLRLTLPAYLLGSGLSVVPGTVRRPSDDLQVQRAMTVLQVFGADPVASVAYDKAAIYEQLFLGLGLRLQDLLLIPKEQLQQMYMALAMAQFGGGGAPAGSGAGSANGPNQTTQGSAGSAGALGAGQ